MMILKLRVVGMQKPLKEDAILRNESIEFGVTNVILVVMQASWGNTGNVYIKMMISRYWLVSGSLRTKQDLAKCHASHCKCCSIRFCSIAVDVGKDKHR